MVINGAAGDDIMPEQSTDERQSLIAMRTNLTRATLAASLLQRRHGDSPDVARLCGHITEAIAHTEREIAALEVSLTRREERDATRSSRQRLRQLGTATEHRKNVAP